MKRDLSKYDEYIYELLSKSEEMKGDGRYEEAIKLLQTLIMNEPECFEAFEEIADNYISLREVKSAEKALQHALKLAGESANAHYLLGFLYSLQEKWEDSVQELEKADDLFPNHPEILRCLGWSIYNVNRKNQGIAVLERSKELAPTDINILCDLGVCYMNSANKEKAKSVFEKVIRIHPNSDQAKECENFLAILESEII